MACAATLALTGGCARAQDDGRGPVYGFHVVRTFPHDRGAFTEGLVYADGQLYESTGEVGRSSIRRVDLDTGKVLQSRDLDRPFFGEGIVPFNGKLYELTWRSGTGFIYDLKTFQPLGRFTYPGEGWALTTDGRRLIMSDGTPQLRFLDPVTLKETGRLTVTYRGRPLANLNEVEWVKGEILANIWMTDTIARIDPKTGRVTGVIDLAGLFPLSERRGDEDVLNGIAYDKAGDRLFVTGKQWPKLYQITLVPPPPGAR